VRYPLSDVRLRQGFSPTHNGVDFVATVGTPVYAPENGVVEWAGLLQAYPGNGLSVGIRGEYEHALLHLSRVDHLQRGDKVVEGQVIGLSGWTGYVIPPGAAGAHLHYSVRTRAGLVWTYIDPVALIARLARVA